MNGLIHLELGNIRLLNYLIILPHYFKSLFHFNFIRFHFDLHFLDYYKG